MACNDQDATLILLHLDPRHLRESVSALRGLGTLSCFPHNRLMYTGPWEADIRYICWETCLSIRIFCSGALTNERLLLKVCSLLATLEMRGTLSSPLRSHQRLASLPLTPDPSQRATARPHCSPRGSHLSLTPSFSFQIPLLPHPNGIPTWSGAGIILTLLCTALLFYFT